MKSYEPTKKEIWKGRKSDDQLYLHEKVRCIDLEKEPKIVANNLTFAILGYACDEGVKRNQGRVGAVKGPNAIRKVLGKMPNHLSENAHLLDFGNVNCVAGAMEEAQKNLSQKVSYLLNKNVFTILLGGGHDIAYGHYKGITRHLESSKIGIINFDAHFDLRSNANGNNSGTPFYQIAQDCKLKGTDFNYLCLGIRQDANDRKLYETANKLGVNFIENHEFTIQNFKNIVKKLLKFIHQVDRVYVTIDLDGFSSAFAPGVSAPSPIGFMPEIVFKSIEVIATSKKLISLDIAELNPTYDVDNHTSKLAASLVHLVLFKLPGI